MRAPGGALKEGEASVSPGCLVAECGGGGRPSKPWCWAGGGGGPPGNSAAVCGVAASFLLVTLQRPRGPTAVGHPVVILVICP